MVGSANAIRGSRIGAGPTGEAERGDAAPRRQVSYFCEHGHESTPNFAADITVPESWDCVRCGLPASQNRDEPPSAPRVEPYKTHLAYVKERRSDEDGEAILEEALQALRQRRNL